MGRLEVFAATTAIPLTRVSSGLHPVAMINGLCANDEDTMVTAASPSLVSLHSHPAPPTRSRPARPRRIIWFTLQPALSVGGISPTPAPARQSAVASALAQAAPAPAAAIEAAALSPMSAAGSVFTAAAAAEPPPAEAPTGVAPAPEEAVPPKPPSAISRVELTIDSLRTYDLSRPIPVVVESLGERNYVAEMPDLNISVSASNPSEIIITLKDRIAQVYDSLRILKHPDAEQARQLRVLETYIVKTRRGWLDRR
jgi:hypothetical protein